MKNKDREIASLWSYVKRLDDLFVRNKDLEDVSIKDCPKCKHPVLAHRTIEEVAFGESGFGKYVYQCLTCGSKFTCSERCVCELVE